MENFATSGLPFMKMNGLGNDFVVVDSRVKNHPLSPALITGIAHRQFGIGFDQLAVITQGADTVHLTFYNADGSTSAACGNATRCIARHLMQETGADSLRLTTDRGDLQAVDVDGTLTAVNMGHPQLSWQEVPLAHEADLLALPIDGAPVATGMGNPHCTFFVEDVAAINLPVFGALHEQHPLFPERTNVQVAQVVGTDHIRMRVWERGVGVTLASGSSSCAVGVAAARLGLTGRKVTIDLDGGQLSVDWRNDGVWMTGPTLHVASGIITPDFMAQFA